MKKILLIFIGIVFFVLIVLVLSQYKQKTTLKTMSSPSTPTLPDPIIATMEEITYNDQVFHFSWTKIQDLSRLSLFSNLQDKLSTQELIEKFKCKVLVNGGFYDQQGDHIGWLISQRRTVSKPVKSDLFNGYLSLKNNQIFIDELRPTSWVDFGLQTGPLLIANNAPLILKIKDDESKRRIVAAKTKDNQLIFLAVVGQDSLFSGPMLADTPAIVIKIAQKINQEFISAINLDGGSASAFYTSDIYIKEFSFIASYFCLY